MGWVCELKSNGYFLLAHKLWGWAPIYSRVRQDLTLAFSEIAGIIGTD